MLFLCTGNSCRSQISEAIVNARFPKWQAVSAGTRPAGYIHPMTIRVLGEIGIQHAGGSKPVNQFRQETFDLVVTVCDEANEECPVWLGGGAQKHWGFRDPAKVDGTEEERLAAFRQVRDQIEAALPGLLA